MSSGVRLNEALINIPKAVAARYERPGTDAHDELVAVGNLELVRSASLFDADRGVPAAAFLYAHVKSRIRSASGRHGTGTRLSDGTYRPRHAERWKSLPSVDDPSPGGSGILEIVADRRSCAPEERIDRADFISWVLSRMRPKDAKVFCLYHRDGLTLAQIGSLFGFNGTRARVLLLRAAAAAYAEVHRQLGVG